MAEPKILIADDDAQLVQLLSLHLKRDGFDVICAQDAYQAVEFARRHAPDVMLLDVNMPAGDGFSVHDRIKTMSDIANTPVIYITGEQSERVSFSSTSLGAFAVIQKPFEADDVVRAVRAALAQSVPKQGEPDKKAA